MAPLDGQKLIQDVYGVLMDPKRAKPLEAEAWAQYGWRTAKHALNDLKVEERGPRPDRTLFASELGEKCWRKLWYKIHYPNLAEPLLGHTKIKFAYGDIIEELVLQYVRAAGYTVEREQELFTAPLPAGWEVRGRIDAIINGTVVDVKSVSTYAFKKYVTEGLTFSNDSFGYQTQLSYYADRASADDAGFLMVNKQTGRLHWEPGRFVNWAPDEEELLVLEDRTTAPVRGHVDVPDGKSGNRKLDVACSYCPYKQLCWAGLRAFNYSTGPVFLTEVKKEPKVPEITLVEAIDATG